MLQSPLMATARWAKAHALGPRISPQARAPPRFSDRQQGCIVTPKAASDQAHD